MFSKWKTGVGREARSQGWRFAPFHRRQAGPGLCRGCAALHGGRNFVLLFVDKARDHVVEMLDRSTGARLTAEVMATVHAATANLGNFVLTNDDRARRAFDQDWADLLEYMKLLDKRIEAEANPDVVATLKDVKEQIEMLQRLQMRIASMTGGPSAIPGMTRLETQLVPEGMALVDRLNSLVERRPKGNLDMDDVRSFQFMARDVRDMFLRAIAALRLYAYSGTEDDLEVFNDLVGVLSFRITQLDRRAVGFGPEYIADLTALKETLPTWVKGANEIVDRRKLPSWNRVNQIMAEDATPIVRKITRLLDGEVNEFGEKRPGLGDSKRPMWWRAPKVRTSFWPSAPCSVSPPWRSRHCSPCCSATRLPARWPGPSPA